MSSSEQLKNENEYYLRDADTIEVFKYPNQASKLIWSIDSNNILQISAQIIEFIKNNKISIKMALYLISNFSHIRVKDIKLFAELYLNISKEFSCIIKPETYKLAMLLCYNGLKFENFEKYAVIEGNINIFMEKIEKENTFAKTNNMELCCHELEIGEYLKSYFGRSPNSIAECMYFGNYDVASFLISNGADINDIYIIFLFRFIIV